MLRRGFDREIILPDFSNVRGVNYIPTYPSVWADPPELPGNLEFVGIASSVAIWRFYTSGDVDQQLGWLRGLGVNTLRVWLNHAVWEHDERECRARGGSNAFLDHFAELLALASKHALYVMPILWDELFVEPSNTPFDDITVWVRNPASAKVNLAWASDPSDPYNGDEYVKAVVRIGRQSEALAMWDIMNEPGQHDAWLRHYCDLVRQHDPNPAHKITIGNAALTPFGGALTAAALDQPTLDVLSYHPYGMFRQNVQAWTGLARQVSQPPFTDRPKPILATEGGNPGEAQRYDDFLAYCSEVRVGSMPFQAMIGRGKFIFGDGQGMLYDDGEMRFEQDAVALRGLGRHQGRLYLELRDTLQKGDLAGFLAPFLPNGFGVDALLRQLHPLAWPGRAKLTDANISSDGYFYQERILTSVDKDLGFLRDFTVVRGILSAEQQATLLEFRREFALRRLPSGPQPWLIGSPPVAIDWAKYDAFFTAWGLVLWKVVNANGLGGQHSPRVLDASGATAAMV